MQGSTNTRQPVTSRKTLTAKKLKNITIDKSSDSGVPGGKPRRSVGHADIWDIPGRARHVHLEAGLHMIIVGPTVVPTIAMGSFTLPATRVVGLPGAEHGPDILSNLGNPAGWLPATGGRVVINIPPGGCSILVTVYGIAEAAALPSLQIIDLEHWSGPEAPPGAATLTSSRSGREIASELLLHVERQGDRQLLARGWVGNPGQRLRVEGFGIRPLEVITPRDIEYMGFGPGGRRTPWVTDGKLCGTRARGLPLTGFAVRLSPPLAERFDVVYEGHFFYSGITKPASNGEPCLPATADDPLAAIRLRIVERIGA